jgi:hypothetical protein
MVCKLVRSVSGLQAALKLAESGQIAETASLLRMVSDFATEITAVAEAVYRDGPPPKAVREFVEQYFTKKAATPAEYDAAERVRYVSREELLKGHVRLAEGKGVDIAAMMSMKRFVNMAYDGYVHGAYETSMELWDNASGEFVMSGHPARQSAALGAIEGKVPEVVAAIEIAAAVMGVQEVFDSARSIRRTLADRTAEPNEAASDQV